jgi:hypothetical protein
VSLGKYTLIVLVLVSGSLALAWPALRAYVDAQGRRAALLGSGIAVANTLLAYVTTIWAERRSTKVFLGAVLGGMLGRMALMLLAVVGAVLGLGLPKVPLTISLLGYFVVFLVFELAVLHRKTSSPAEAR